MGIIDRFTNVKDKVLSKTVMTGLGLYIQPYGKILDLDLDSIERTLELTMDLRGEVSPVTVILRQYEVKIEEDRGLLSVQRVEVSREWMNTLAKELLAGTWIEIPKSVAKALRIVV